MTEQEWLAATDPALMLEFLRGKASDRKLRLFAVACCRFVWHLLTDPRSQNAVKTAERFADGHSSQAELIAVREAAVQAHQAAANRDGIAKLVPLGRLLAWKSRAKKYATYAAVAATEEPLLAAPGEISWDVCGNTTWAAGEGWYGWFVPLGNHYRRVHSKQCVALRDIFGNPFRPVSVDPVWLTSTVFALAQAIYNEWAFDRLPILADALEDAGCTQEEILNHCRQPGEHVRGCWPVDLVLHKK